MTVRIVTDSSCDLDDAEARALGIEIVPLTIRFGDEEHVDRVELTVEDFYAKMATSDVLPQTAAPAPGAFEERFRSLAAAGADAIVCVNLSLELSATGQAARTAAEAVADTVDVRCVDSRSITAGLGTMALEAARAAQTGASADDICVLLDSLIERTRVFGVLDTLENLKKGGRIGTAKALLGTMLSFKPCLDLSSGVVVEAGRQRTRRKALAWLRDIVAEAAPVEHLSVIHGQAPDVEEFRSMIADVVPLEDQRVSTLGAVIGTHGGPRVLGVTFLTGT